MIQRQTRCGVAEPRSRRALITRRQYVVNDPGAWGAAEPTILVLGFQVPAPAQLGDVLVSDECVFRADS